MFGLIDATFLLGDYLVITKLLILKKTKKMKPRINPLTGREGYWNQPEGQTWHWDYTCLYPVKIIELSLE